MRFASRYGAAVATLEIVAATAFAGIQAGCENNEGPTAPTQSFFERADYTILVQPSEFAGQYPRSAEILLDHGVVWAGPILPPGSVYSNESGSAILKGSLANLTRDSHSLAFRIAQETASPYRYLVGGRVDLVWSNRRVVGAASWGMEPVNLATGDS
jgi:hypothetical protein